MFEDLSDQIRKDEKAASSPKERVLIWTAVVLSTLLAFAAVYYGLQNIS